MIRFRCGIPLGLILIALSSTNLARAADIAGLREAFIGVASAPEGEASIVGSDPVHHHCDGMLSLADRAQGRTELGAYVGRGEIIGVLRIRRPEEQHIAGGKVWQRR